MNRRLSMALAAYGVWNQALLLFLIEPLKKQVSEALQPELTVGDLRLLGLSLDGFAVRDPHHVGGWLPQIVFLTVSGLLTYGVLRGSTGIRPRLRTVLALAGAMLLAAGVAILIGPALDPDAPTAMPTYGEWVVRAQIGEVPAAAAQFVLLTLWLPLVPWLLVWRYREWPPLRTHLGTAEDAESGKEPGPAPITARERRHLVCAGLIPAVLLAVAGGPVLRHIRVRHLSQGAPGAPGTSITFDPELWDSYTPPPLIDEWSGVLYPALRLRPLRTELVGGWIVTLVVCVVFLGALALALRSVAARWAGLSRRGPTAFIGLVMKGWYATLLAAVAAAFVDGLLLRWFAPRRESGAAAADHPGVALGDAVRFGAAWGWATGLVCLGAVLLMARRAVPAVPPADEYEDQPVPEREERSAHGD
ncbi:hypothetical protein [Streptomyces sp. BPSDS2]|uniref:hypothetical protein n=1 Tax=Streptomyces sp. BPSDS2 TaxID=2571021 RepID=UPI0010C1617E|nr:hypothetical protein [Streptomyces sp. BPSDS2]